MVQRHIRQWFSDGRSELFVWLLLLVAIVNLIVLLVWGQSLFMSVRLRFNDLYFVDAPIQDNIVLVAIDDASLEQYGSTPAEWSRAVFADFLSIMAEAQPRVIALDLLFTGAEAEDAQLIESLAALRRNDIRTQIVVAGAGVNQQSHRQSLTTTPSLSFVSELSLIDGMLASVNYVGFTNTLADIDGIVRRQPSLLVIGGDHQHFSFSLATYLAYLRIPSAAAEQVVMIQPDQLILPDGESIQIDELGFWQQNYFGSPESSFPTISYLDIMTGQVDLAQFREKIVLVGVMEATGSLDRYLVPSATTHELMAGIEIQAHALESILQKNTLRHPSSAINIISIIAVIWFSALTMLLFRWYFKLLIGLIWGVVLVVIGSFLFSTQGVVFNLFDPLIGIALVQIALIGFDISFEAMRRRQTEFVLESVQQIAQQRLNLERSLPFIKQDIRQLLPDAKQIDIFFVGDQPDSKPSPAIQKVIETRQLIEERGIVGLPLMWQGAIQIVLSIQHSARKLTRRQRQRLRDFVAQLSPSLDNIALYQDLQRQKQLVDKIFAKSPVGFALLNNQGMIESYNQHILHLLNLEEDNLVGKTYVDILEAVVDSQKELDFIKHSIADNLEFFTNITVGDKSANVAIAKLPEYDLRVVVLSDTSTLTELNRLKTQMLRMASHDLKNPLSRVIGFAELITIIGDPLTEKQQEYLNYIEDSGQEMLRIIEDVLALERLRAGEISVEPVDLAAIVEQVSMSHQPDTIRKQQHFSYEKPDQPIMVKGNTSQLSQSIANLVGNAIKYTPEEGTITVCVSPQDDKAHFEVVDTGYGIPEAAQEKLFTEFFRVKTNATRNIQGTGLGLSLVKTIVEKHEGKVGFQSEEGKGSTFWIELPLMEE